MMIYGLQPGPLLLKQTPQIFWGVIASMYVGNVFLLILNLPLIPLWVKVLRVPQGFLFTFILLFCLIGAYSLNNNIADMIVMILFGILGYLLREFKYEVAPLMFSFVLGPIIEPAFRRSLILSKGSMGIFFTRPISAVFLIVAITLLTLPMLTKTRLGAGRQEED
jgi:putative tricarboxylic transport membrane protein